MNECQARSLVRQLTVEGWFAHAYFESGVDGCPEKWHVTITKRRPQP